MKLPVGGHDPGGTRKRAMCPRWWHEMDLKCAGDHGWGHFWGQLSPLNLVGSLLYCGREFDPLFSVERRTTQMSAICGTWCPDVRMFASLGNCRLPRRSLTQRRKHPAQMEDDGCRRLGSSPSHWRSWHAPPLANRRTVGAASLPRLKLDLRLFEHPSFDLVMPHPEKIERAASIMLFGDCRRLMSLDLSDDADRNLDPL